MNKEIRQDLITGKYKPVDLWGEDIRLKDIKWAKNIGFRTYVFYNIVLNIIKETIKIKKNIKAQNEAYLTEKNYSNEYTYQKWLEGNPIPTILRYNDQDKIEKEQEAAYQKRLHDAFQVMKGSFLDFYEFSVLPDKYLNYEIKEIESGLIQIDFEKYFFEGKENWNSKDLGWSLTREQVEQYTAFNYEREITGWSDEASDLREEVYVNKDYIKGEEPTYLAYIVNYKFLQWLKWFKEKEALSNKEPTINKEANTKNYLPNSTMFINHSISKVSYKWQGNPEEDLPELFQLMKGKFIYDSTSLEQFKAIFERQPIETITPVRWHDTNASELLYFILQLEQTDNISKNGNRSDYQKLKSCFIMPNGKPFTASFKELKQKVNIELSKEKRRAIDGLVKNFT